MTDQSLQDLRDEVERLKGQIRESDRAFDIRMGAIIADANKVNEELTIVIEGLAAHLDSGVDAHV